LVTVTGRTVPGAFLLVMTSPNAPVPPPAGSSAASPPVPALLVDEVSVRRDGHLLIDRITLRVERDQRWIVLGANGSGKTTLLRIMALYDHPSSGGVEVLGERLGRTDVRELRRRVGYVAAAFADQLRRDLIARDVVKTAKFAALEPWWHRYSADDEERADECLDRLHVAHLGDRRFGTLSSGEQQRVLLARSLMNDPAVVLLDEPSARLDLGGREELVATLTSLATDRDAPPFVMVTHHVDEIPTGATHAALLRDGRLLDSGPIEEVLTADGLSDTFGLALRVERRSGGRYTAWAEH
jgi:iron complex transport system ATP-binding protein